MNSSTAIMTLRDLSLTLADIRHAAAVTCRVRESDMMAGYRARQIVRARHIYFALARELSRKSFPVIAHHCGGKDHATAIKGSAQVAARPGKYEPELSAARRFARKQTGG